MKKLSLVSLFALMTATILASGCAGKAAPLTIDSGGYTGSSGDTPVTPVDPKTNVSGANGAGGEMIVPTVRETVSDSGSTVPATPPVTEGDRVADDTPEIGTPPSPPAETFTCRDPEPLEGHPGIDHCIEGYCKYAVSGKRLECPYGNPEGSSGTGSMAGTSVLGYLLPPSAMADALKNFRPIVMPSQHDQDVTHLMNDTFQPDDFTVPEQEMQRRVMAERTPVGEDFGGALKSYVVTVLRGLIDAERNNGDFNGRTAKLSEVITAFKSGDMEKVSAATEGSDIAIPTAIAYRMNPDVLKTAGSYLEIQFAEAYKDIAKASFQANGEVNQMSTLVAGGDAFGLVYKPDGFVDAGFNHIGGLGSNGDQWHEGTSNWHAVAEGIRGALNAELHPVDAAAAVQAIENINRSFQEQGEAIARQIGHW